ncbi:unnamed protein product [Amoebophrya sp. A25]|nr:unnamed protein product [Amoebophrya sp. A25]|eukprot:GSA25T00006181001.1
MVGSKAFDHVFMAPSSSANEPAETFIVTDGTTADPHYEVEVGRDTYDKSGSLRLTRREIFHVLFSRLDASGRKSVLSRKTSTFSGVTQFNIRNVALSREKTRALFTCSGSQTGMLLFETADEKIKQGTMIGSSVGLGRSSSGSVTIDDKKGSIIRTKGKGEACAENLEQSTHETEVSTLDAEWRHLLDAQGSGSNHISESRTGSGADDQRQRSTSAPSTDFAEILLLKIDAEGHDSAIMHGGEHLLASKLVRFLLFEVNLDTAREFVDVLQFLLGLGYGFCYAIMPDALLPVNERHFYETFEQVFDHDDGAEMMRLQMDNKLEQGSKIQLIQNQRGSYENHSRVHKVELVSLLQAYFDRHVPVAFNVVCTHRARFARLLHQRYTRNQQAYSLLFQSAFDRRHMDRNSAWWLRTGVGVALEERRYFHDLFPGLSEGGEESGTPWSLSSKREPSLGAESETESSGTRHGKRKRTIKEKMKTTNQEKLFLSALSRQLEVDQERWPWWSEEDLKNSDPLRTVVELLIPPFGGDEGHNYSKLPKTNNRRNEDDSEDDAIYSAGDEDSQKVLHELALSQMATVDRAKHHFHLYEPDRYLVRNFLDVVAQRAPGKGLTNLAARRFGSRFMPNYIIEPRIMTLGTILDSKHVQKQLLNKLAAVEIAENRDGVNDFYHEMARYLERRAHEAGFLDWLWQLCGAELWYVAAWRKRGSVGSFLSLIHMGWSTTSELDDNNDASTHGAQDASLEQDSACLVLERAGRIDLEGIYARFVNPHDFAEFIESQSGTGQTTTSSSTFASFYQEIWRNPQRMLEVHYNLTRAASGQVLPRTILPWATAGRQRTELERVAGGRLDLLHEDHTVLEEISSTRTNTKRMTVNHLRYPMAKTRADRIPETPRRSERMLEVGRIFLWDFVQDEVMRTDLRTLFWSNHFLTDK